MDGWMDGWVGGWKVGKAGLKIAYSNQKKYLAWWKEGWMGGWMDGWMDGWVEGRESRTIIVLLYMINDTNSNCKL